MRADVSTTLSLGAEQGAILRTTQTRRRADSVRRATAHKTKRNEERAGSGEQDVMPSNRASGAATSVPWRGARPHKHDLVSDREWRSNQLTRSVIKANGSRTEIGRTNQPLPRPGDRSMARLRARGGCVEGNLRERTGECDGGADYRRGLVRIGNRPEPGE